ncbi:organoarsenical effux MFS transporter ArsJ [Shewanella sp. 202IG2-18]|uniref:organoarsenical effux MFS transporter ArsJ n=1 Tax=Parashewanella hymeniacidonis TaxID=2807618 RepID=UPI0019616FB6|nr:organoarsenical effux MFS transporter ArsJ [Parashewanella hymeniacidonis]MBM7071461.1 organoarsenical effux MFS transporter ArsJ [Parashewanella hymeniacidonis]
MLAAIKSLPESVKQYLIITGNYWCFTLTDGALRMLVVLHFHQLGYSPLEIAMLFLFYEFFGVVTNLVGGYLGAKLGLNRTMNIGLALQVFALLMLTFPAELLPSVIAGIPWVMAAQAFSGIAKDLNKMSAKSAIKTLIPANAQGKLYQWVALLTGSKNALKGIGFFLGGLLLTVLGYQDALFAMAIALAVVWVFSIVMLKQELGKSKAKPKFKDLFSKSREINLLSAARLCLFASRDVWFVVALPVYLAVTLNWTDWEVGSFMALWVIGYGIVQALAPKVTGKEQGQAPTAKAAIFWLIPLSVIPALIALGIGNSTQLTLIIVSGLLIFGALFAVNSSLHSYLIVSYAKADGVSLDVGFYYMANAMGRLIGTVLSGWIYQVYGLEACLWFSSALLAIAFLVSLKLPYKVTNQ